MKLLPVFLPVVALHVGLIVLFLAQPGCQTRPTPPAPNGAETAAAQATTTVRTVNHPVVESAPVTSRQSPMRPVGSSTSSDLPSAFNGGLAIESDEPVLQPLIKSQSVAAEDVPLETYVIGKGDTLSSIARIYGVSVQNLRSANNLSSDRIYVGQELQVPATTATSAPSTARSTSNSDTYVVQKGDNLTRIAQRTASSVGKIRSANGLTSDRILVGQSLIIPSVGSSTSSAPVRSAPPRRVDGATYVVAPGDTLSAIGAKHGVNFRRIMEANDITDPTRLFVGQELVIPGLKANTVTSAPASRRTIVPPVESRPAPVTSTPVYVAPSRPVEIQPNQIDPEELEARLNELPISDSEVVEPIE